MSQEEFGRGGGATTLPSFSQLSMSPSRVLGRYELLVPIAEGGMASVWAARMKGQRGFQKIVAIKQMRPELSDDPSFETMFLDEAALVAQLKHPHLAEIFDLGEVDGQLYQVMEYVDGEPLNRLLRKRKGAIPMPLVVHIGKEVCAGLHAAHELRNEAGELVGLVHRDVSLQNILVSYEGVTKVIDFGVAKAISNLQHTNVGQVKGKVPYMSPEQAIGDPLDRRTDVFALGIVLYQLATGKHPFRGESELETMMHICEKTSVAAPSTIAPAVPPKFDAVILKALEKEREARYATMAEMLRALESVFPPDQQGSSEQLRQFMHSVLGERGEQRRRAIQEAQRAADVAAAADGKGPISGRNPNSNRSSDIRPPTSRPGVPSSAPRPAASERTTGGIQLPAPPQKSAWSQIAGPARTMLLAFLMGFGGLGLGLGAVSLISPDAHLGASPVALFYPLLSAYGAISGAVSNAAAALPDPRASMIRGAPALDAGAGPPDAAAEPSEVDASNTAKPKPKPSKPRLFLR